MMKLATIGHKDYVRPILYPEERQQRLEMGISR